MTDRERLIGLLVAGMFKFSEKGIVDNTALADYILSDGWIRPPCKVGDKVYAIGDKDGHQIKECKAEEFFFVDAEKFQVGVCFECDTDCEGCYFSSWSQSHCGEWSCDGEYGNGFIPVEDFGKTVFLTREEAEKSTGGKAG